MINFFKKTKKITFLYNGKWNLYPYFSKIGTKKVGGPEIRELFSGETDHSKRKGAWKCPAGELPEEIIHPDAWYHQKVRLSTWHFKLAYHWHTQLRVVTRHLRMVSNTKYRGQTNQPSNLEDLETKLREKEREVKTEAGRRKEEINTLGKWDTV